MKGNLIETEFTCHVLLLTVGMYRIITGNESYILVQSSKSSSKIQCCHRHPYHSLGDILVFFILCYKTTILLQPALIISSHLVHWRREQKMFYLHRGDPWSQNPWAPRTVCVGYVLVPGAFPLAGSDLLLHGTWLDWGYRVGTHCQSCQLEHQISLRTSLLMMIAS